MQEQQETVLPKPIFTSPLKIFQLGPNNRTIKTTKKVNRNRILIQSKPIATAVLTSMRNKICNNCLKENEVTRCSICKIMYYCSMDCQKQDWPIHKLECPILQKLTKQKNIPIQKIVTEFCLNLRIYLIRQNNQQINEQINSMICLLQYQSPEKKQQYQELTTILIENLGIDKNEANFTKIIQQICTVSLNLFTIQDYLCSYDSIGIGLYYPTNFINHSCEPNCQQIFDGNTLKIITLKEIGENEEISINYVGRLLVFEERQKQLKEGYLFMCFCDRCQAQKMYDWQIFYLLCPKCQKQGLIREGLAQISEKQLKEDGLLQGENDSDEQAQQKDKEQTEKDKKRIIICTSCNQKIPNEQVYEKLCECEKYLLQFQKPEHQTTYKKLKKAFFALKALFSFKNPLFEETLGKVYLKCLSEAASDPKLYDQAYILLKDLLQNLKVWYRIDPEQQQLPYYYAWKYAQLGKLAYMLSEHGKKGKLKKAGEYTEKAHEMINKIGFKNKFVQVEQLQKRYQEIKISLSMKKTEVLSKN